MLRLRDVPANEVNGSVSLSLATAICLVEILSSNVPDDRVKLIRTSLETDSSWRQWWSRVLQRADETQRPDDARESNLTDELVHLVDDHLVDVILHENEPFCEFIAEAHSQVGDDMVATNSNCDGTIAAMERSMPAVIFALADRRRLLASFSEKLEQEKLAAMVQLAYGAGHEINNPLANIATRAQTLMRDEKDPERRHRLATINSQVFRAHEMIADMMLFAKPPKPTKTNTDLVALVNTVANEIKPLAVSQQSQIELVLPSDPLFANLDETQICVALKALCANSLHAIGSGGTITVALRPCVEKKLRVDGVAGSSKWIEISVTDNGPGISPEVRKHIFDPFYSGREAGRGLGFGLSKCWRIVTLHGGSIRVESEPSVLTRFTIELPADADSI